jgi:hypothetical protein
MFYAHDILLQHCTPCHAALVAASNEAQHQALLLASLADHTNPAPAYQLWHGCNVPLQHPALRAQCSYSDCSDHSLNVKLWHAINSHSFSPTAIQAALPGICWC